MGNFPDHLNRLIEHFDQQSDQVRSPDYNEAQLRIDFVNPLFAALGWDMDNSQRFAEQYREVVHEDRVKVAGQTKAPDYSFRVGGVRKFFLEAKKPAVKLKDAWEPAYQLRRYGWSAKLPVSILTNFEELAVYDCRIAPKQFDKSATARRLYITYREYPERWDFLLGTFSKQAVLQGEFDRYCQTAKGRGRQEFDDTFLEEIEEWRKSLAANLALRNDNLDEPGLNFAVQRIIDRIIFLRMAEDRGTESTGQLQALLAGEQTYPRLQKLFRDADARYNSGLFHFTKEPGRDEAPDTLTPGLEIDDHTLKEIIDRLYYPKSPYEFTVVTADILGSVYERFLGKVITLTPGHRARIEEKPEVRKAGGVYYTPTYIVDYIVKNTVGKLLDGPPLLTPAEAKKLKILDPACGSGSFLIGAYQYLLDWHLAQYTAADPQSKATGRNPVLRPTDTGGWKLTISERKRILLDNIHGVDLDAAAVEVTKLNLLLKCLEGETSQTLNFQRRIWHDRALPDLGHNILCGNSLIGTDIMATDLWAKMSDDEKRKINPFDYERAFSKVFKQGGFDAVIGNPPWGQKEITKDAALDEYIRIHFPSVSGIFDLFRPFVELAVNVARQDGLIGQVLPDIILLKDYESTRRLLLERTTLEKIDWWGMAFADAVIDAATIVATRAAPRTDHRLGATIRENGTIQSHELLQADFSRNPRSTFNLTMTDDRRSIIGKLASLPRLSEYFGVHEGVHSGNMREQLFVDRKADASCRALLFGRDEIAPYRLHWNGRYIRLSALPKSGSAAHYANIGRPAWHENPKVLVRRTGDHVLAAVDAVGRYCSNNFFLIFPTSEYPLDLYGLTALLNSRHMTAYFRMVEPRKGRVFSEIKIKHLGQFPLPPPNAGPVRKLNDLGHRRSELEECRAASALPADADRFAREAEQLDQSIDDVAAELLGLTSADRNLLSPLLES